jgi:hypothetical protein
MKTTITRDGLLLIQAMKILGNKDISLAERFQELELTYNPLLKRLKTLYNV